MATFLYRIGRWAYTNRLKTIAIWVLALILFGIGAATLAKPTSESFSIPGIPSEQAQDLMTERFPDAPVFGEGAPFTLVIAAPEGENLTEQRYQDAIDAMTAEVREIDGVLEPETGANPFPAFGTPDAPGEALTQLAEAQEAMGASPQEALENAVAMAPISLDQSAVQIEGSFDAETPSEVTTEQRDALRDVAQTGEEAGLDVAIGGSAMQEIEIGLASEAIGLAVGAIILILTFASLVAWGMPILTAIIGVAVGMLGVSIGTYFFELSSETPILATMIGLAVGIDYALFILMRYRHEVHLAPTRAEAAGRAVGTAGSAVVFAGSTVIIALAALAIVNIPFLTAMGLAAAGTVLVAVLVALTLLPAILGLFGAKVFSGRLSFLNAPDVEPNEHAQVRNGQRYANQIVKRPWMVTGAVVIGMLLLALPATGLKLALPNEGMSDPSTSERQAYDMVADRFAPGANNPLLVVADGQDVAEDQRIPEFNALLADIRQLDGVQFALIGQVNEAGDTAMLQVIPTGDSTSEATQNLVTELRDMEGAVTNQTGLTYGVTGQTAIEIDISERLSDSLIPYVLVVVGLAFLLLIAVFRSVLVPLVAALGFLLSVAATFGVTVALWTDGALGLVSNPQPLVSFLPIMLVGIVFGLAMDYQVFLVTRMREAYVHGTDARSAVVVGYRHSARVVAAAAAIMVSVFGAFMLQEMQFIMVMGFALAAAVFFDAFVVRMTLMPALLTILGDKAWWIPKWLDKALPAMDIEGDALDAGSTATEDKDREKVGASS